MCQRAKTMQEEVFSGLLGGSLPYELELVEVEGKGRGVRVKEKVPMGAYVCEYEGEVYPRKERAAREREYAVNGEGCYILDCQTREGWICIDATRSYSAIGRLLNHAPSFLATLVPYKPLLVNGQWRVGFVASKNLMPGDELLWDYGCEPGGEEWLMQRRRATDISAKESALEFFDTELHVGRDDAEEQWEEDDKEEEGSEGESSGDEDEEERSKEECSDDRQVKIGEQFSREEEERSEGESSGDEDEEERMALGEHTQGESAISKDCNKESEQPRLGSKSVKRKRWKHRGSLMHKRKRLERQQTLSAFRKASKLSRKKASSAKSVSSAVRGRLRHRRTLASFRKALLRKAACGTKSTSPEKQQRARALEDDYTEVGLNLDSMPWFGELQSKTLYKGKLFSSTGQALLTPSVSSPRREGLQEFFVQQKSMGRVQEYPCKQLTSSKDGLGSPSREPPTSSQQKKAIVKTEVSGSSSKTSSVRQESMGRVHLFTSSKDGLSPTKNLSRKPPTSFQQNSSSVASLSSDYSSSTPYPYSASAAGASEDESGDTTAGLVGSDEEGDGEKSLWGGDGQDSGSSLSDTVAVIYWHVICIQDKVRTLLKEAYRK